MAEELNRHELNEIAFQEALLKAQMHCKNPPLDGKNPHFNSKFSTLKTVREHVVPIFHEHGIVIIQECEREDGINVLATYLQFRGRKLRAGGIPLLLKDNDMQKLAGAITYARRIGLQLVSSIVGDDDDDGNVATRPVEKISGAKVKQISKLLDETGSDVEKFMEYYQVSKLNDLTEDQMPKVLHQLHTKSAEMKKENDSGE